MPGASDNARSISSVQMISLSEEERERERSKKEGKRAFFCSFPLFSSRLFSHQKTATNTFYNGTVGYESYHQLSRAYLFPLPT